MKRNNGITLIALVITIIVLIILAGVAINLTLGENGILTKSQLAKDEYTNASVLEEQQINAIDNYIEQQTKQEKEEPEQPEEPKVLKYDSTKLNEKIVLNNVNIDEDGIIEMSESDSYVTIDEAFLPGNNTWEVATKFKFNSTQSNFQAVIGKSGLYNPVYVAIHTNRKLQLHMSSNDNAWDMFANTGTKVVDSETWYWIKLRFDGNSYQVLISEDGVNYVTDIEVKTATIAYQKDKYVLGDNLLATQKFYGYYDLKETYIKIGDSYFFNGLDYFSYQ